jgi:nucleoside-diphosphate-sugar epimerase
VPKRALITGATGFTGRYLAPKLAAAGYEVHGTVHGDAGDPVAGVAKLHRVDLADSTAVGGLIREASPHKVAHLAAIAFVAHSDVGEMYRSNILGTRNLLGALASVGCADAVLLASSANVYGNARQRVLDEILPPNPANDYGVTKAAVELLAGIYSDRLPLIVVRPFNYTGRGQSDRFLIPKIVFHVRRRALEIELGNIEIARDFSDVRSVVEAYARILETPGAVGTTLNVCSGCATSLRDLIAMTERITGHRMTVRVNPAFVRDDEVKSLCGSNKKLRETIGSLPTLPLEHTLRWMLEE